MNRTRRRGDRGGGGGGGGEVNNPGIIICICLQVVLSCLSADSTGQQGIESFSLTTAYTKKCYTYGKVQSKRCSNLIILRENRLYKGEL